MKLRVGNELVLQPPVEAYAFLPFVRVSQMGVVGGDESLNVLGGHAGIGQVGPLEALAAQDREPNLDKAQPGRVHWQEVEHELTAGMSVQPPQHLSRPVG